MFGSLGRSEAEGSTVSVSHPEVLVKVPSVCWPRRGFGERARAKAYPVAKRLFDLFVVSVALMPTFLLVALCLLLLNRWFNPGRLFFTQERMGQGCRPFRTWKFRSMVGGVEVARGPFDPLDAHRITPLGQFLRKSRLDELPQIINVLRGEMSLIGPRPDYYPHACIYAEEIPGYRERHAVLPGITGLAQVQVGYVLTRSRLKQKVEADLHYVRHASLRFDLWITWRTVLTVLGREGS